MSPRATERAVSAARRGHVRRAVVRACAGAGGGPLAAQRGGAHGAAGGGGGAAPARGGLPARARPAGRHDLLHRTIVDAELLYVLMSLGARRAILHLLVPVLDPAARLAANEG